MATTPKNKKPTAKVVKGAQQLISQDPAQLSPLDPVEKAVMRAFEPDAIYLPQPVRHSVVTSEQVTDILHDIPASEIEDAIANSNPGKLSKVSLDDDIVKESTSLQKITEFDRAVIEGALALLVSSNTVMTSAMIYRAMTGKTNSEYVSAEQKRSVDISMQKCMTTLFSVDINMPNDNGNHVSADFSGYVIPAERIRVNVAGVQTTAYQILKTPVLYRLCVKTEGLTLTPLDVLNINMNYTKRNLAILNYLQRRIAPLIYPYRSAEEKPPVKYAKSKPILIKYKELYDMAMEEDGKDVKNTYPSTFKARIRETAHTIFNAWVDAGYLSGWDDVSIASKNAITGVRLSFPEIAPEPVNLIGQSSET